MLLFNIILTINIQYIKCNLQLLLAFKTLKIASWGEIIFFYMKTEEAASVFPYRRQGKGLYESVSMAGCVVMLGLKYT